MLAVKRRIFDESIAVFTEATEPLHPDIEKQARRFSAYTITTGAVVLARYFSDYSPYLNPDEGKPLSQSIVSLRKEGYETGIYLDPLKAEMTTRLLDGGFNPDTIASVIEKAFEENQRNGKRSFPELGEQQIWFVREALFTVSSLDDEGNYKNNNPRSVVSRAPEVVQDIIDYLHGLAPTK